MEFVTNRLIDLGKQVAATSDRSAASERTLTEARSRLFSQHRQPELGRLRRSLRLALAAVVFSGLCGVATFGALGHFTNRAVTYVVRDAPTSSRDSFIETTQTGSEIRFSEGSLVSVLPETGLRVLDTKPSGVILSVERGAVRCSVVHRKGTAWTVRAGPFDIRVIGTKFAARWQPVAGRFELSLEEGSVEVTGPQLSGAQRVVTGEHLIVELHQGTKSLTQGQPNTEASTTSADSATVPASDVAAAESPAAVATPTAVRAPEPLPWEELARAGKYKDALKLVDGTGFDAVLARSDAAGARLLADTARMAGSPRKAKQALLSLRNQHGKRAETAFLLGKVAADQLRAPAEALSWFDTYLAEQPKGPLREQAMGRSLELEQHVGGQRAVTRAKRYLAEYPNGAYAPLAKQILAKVSSATPR